VAGYRSFLNLKSAAAVAGLVLFTILEFLFGHTIFAACLAFLEVHWQISDAQMTASLAQYAIPLAASGVLAWFIFWAGQRHGRMAAGSHAAITPPIKADAQLSQATLAGNNRPKIEIRFEEKHRPYETWEISHNQMLSTISIGLKNTGEASASNCKVYIENIAPLPSPFYGAPPIQIDGSGFVLRADDPEKLIPIAGKWGNSTKYRFLAPHSGWAETLNYIECGPERAVEIKIVSTECTESAIFMIECNGHSALCMKRVR
jgi:hypothetical protein